MNGDQEAARRLFVTQPAISRSIRELEGDLGIPLLVRSARGATLTPYAVGVLKCARAIHREVHCIIEDVEAIRGKLNGQLTLAMTPPAASRALADTLTELAAGRPEATLHVFEWRAEQIVDGMRDGIVDVGLLTQYSEPQTSSFEWQQLYQLDTLLAISGNYQDSTDLTIEQLHALPWLVLDSIDDVSSFIVTLFGQHKLPLPERIIRCSSMTLYSELAMSMPAVSIWTSPALRILGPRFQAGTMKRLRIVGWHPVGRHVPHLSKRRSAYGCTVIHHQSAVADRITLQFRPRWRRSTKLDDLLFDVNSISGNIRVVVPEWVNDALHDVGRSPDLGRSYFRFSPRFPRFSTTCIAAIIAQ